MTISAPDTIRRTASPPRGRGRGSVSRRGLFPYNGPVSLSAALRRRVTPCPYLNTRNARNGHFRRITGAVYNRRIIIQNGQFVLAYLSDFFLHIPNYFCITACICTYTSDFLSVTIHFLYLCTDSVLCRIF